MAIERVDLELKVLQRLREGLMDGVVGHENTFGDMTRRRFIKDGRPFLSKYPANTDPTEDTLIIEKEFETDEGKLWFIRNHGWVMNDVYACLYSHMFKRFGGL